ncbi:MAG: hypothetical protein H6838_16525 [Planctomycetes bacterium]|nr:hypothetical protein [Planctomycetota bacterium]
MLHPAYAALIAGAGCGLALWVNGHRWGFLPDDPPSLPRKQHDRPIPLAGVVLLPCVLWWFASLEHAATLLALAIATATGFADDRGKEHGEGLDWRVKGALLAVAALIGASQSCAPLQAPGDWLLLAALAFVLCNATNFLDNMDGVATSLSAVTLLSIGGGGPFAAVGFAALGLLPWNWPRPRLFLGDAGAYLLGMAAGLAVGARALVAPIELLAAGVQLADFVQVISARLWLRLPPWVGDRRHLSHIAHHRGVPRWLVAPLLAALAALLANRG